MDRFAHYMRGVPVRQGREGVDGIVEDDALSGQEPGQLSRVAELLQ